MDSSEFIDMVGLLSQCVENELALNRDLVLIKVSLQQIISKLKCQDVVSPADILPYISDGPFHSSSLHSDDVDVDGHESFVIFPDEPINNSGSDNMELLTSHEDIPSLDMASTDDPKPDCSGAGVPLDAEPGNSSAGVPLDLKSDKSSAEVPLDPEPGTSVGTTSIDPEPVEIPLDQKRDVTPPKFSAKTSDNPQAREVSPIRQPSGKKLSC